MRLKLCLVLIILVVLIATGGSSVSADNTSLTFFFNDQKVEPEVKAIIKDNVKYVNLAFLAKYVHAVTDWNPSSGELYLRFGELSSKLSENSTEYALDKSWKNLAHAPFEQGDQLWIPVEYLANLGIKIKGEDHSQLNLGWADNYLLGMENLTYQGRPAFILVSSSPIKLKSYLLTQPDRLVLDLVDLKAHPSFDNRVNENQVVEKVRFHQSEDDALRLVFDLKKLTGYKLIRSADDENRLLLVFNYLVEEVSLFQQDQERKLLIKTSFPAKYNVFNLENPSRLVIDFEGASIGPSVTPFSGDGKWIGTVRMSQYAPDVVRVVLDLLDTNPTFVVPSRDKPNLLEIRTVQEITKLTWSESEAGGKLVIEGNASLLERIRKQRNPERLWLEFDYARFNPKLQAPILSGDQVKGVRLVPVNSTTARIELDLGYFVGYNARFSPDRRQLSLIFKRSPLIGKTIVLDAGHGGVDPGACGRQGTREKEINLEVVLRLKDQLEEAGARVVLTRADDTFISLYERSFMANYLFADLFISIHTNNHNDFNVHGEEVYFFPGHTSSKGLAKAVHDNLVENTELTGLGVKTNDFVVIREIQMPGILVELGYLSNYQEENIIRTEEFRANAAQGVFQGIVEYFNK